MIGVKIGDSGGISVTGETPQERGFCDEEARRTPHGKRPIVTEINGIVEIWTFSVASLGHEDILAGYTPNHESCNYCCVAHC